MIYLHFTPEDLVRIRFSFSPVWECVSSLRTLGGQHGLHADLHGRGLLLVPCAFAWPDVIVRTADPQPVVTYEPRGAGVLGRSRACILAQLDLPMSTTQLAAQLDLTAPTLNVHLKALLAAGIVSTRRVGRTVLYSRTQLGESLLAGVAILQNNSTKSIG